MINGTHTYTKSGLRRKPDLPTICQWILDAWRELPSKIIVKAFKKCGISNAMDGTEDDCLWEEKDSEDDSDGEEDTECSAYYTDKDFPWTEEQYDELFHSESEEEEFEGFMEEDIDFHRD